jgi:hypothetical protein
VPPSDTAEQAAIVTPRPPRIELGTVNGVVCTTLITAEPWNLGVDTLVIPAGADGLGDLGIALHDAVPRVEFPPDSFADLRAEGPRLVPVPPPTDPGAPSDVLARVIVATASRRVPPAMSAEDLIVPQVEAAGTAAAASVATAVGAGAQFLGIPLIGAGAAGLEPMRVADALVPNVRVALSNIAPGALHEVVLLAIDGEEADAISQAWRGFKSPAFKNDRPQGEDLLGIRNEVYALADMLLLRDVRPPLAVGVLGGWGRGKSFVMHLLQKRMHEIRGEKLTEDQSWGRSASPFVGHIYPITFNAWTYARADLWAGLIYTVFTQLDEQLGIERVLRMQAEKEFAANEKAANEKAANEKADEELSEEERAAKEKADKERTEAQKELAGLAAVLDGTRWAEVSALPASLRQLFADTPLTDSTGTHLARVLRDVYAGDRKDLAQQQEKLADLRRKQAAQERDLAEEVDQEIAVGVDEAGWKNFAESVGGAVGAGYEQVAAWLGREAPELESLWQTSDATIAEARQLSAALGSLRVPPTRVAWAVVKRHWVTSIVLLCAGAALAAAAVFAGPLVGRIGGLVAAGIALATSLMSLVSSGIRTARRAAESLGAWRRVVDEQIAEREDDRRRAITQKVLADPDLLGTRTQVAETEAQVELLSKRVELVSQFTSVTDLVEARLATSGYREQLGMMQQISDDLRDLSESLTVTDLDDPHLEEKRKVFPRGPARVVLFIDDLDRCPPNKVVEVLEAVQLLLATDLFVVVLAIDVRYVTKSLERVYRGVLEANGDPSGIDYLEKIIQIPYRTRDPDCAAVQVFLRDQLTLVEAPVEVESTPSPTGHQPAAPTTTPTESPTAQAIARQLLFSAEELSVLSECCARLELSPRATKRVANIVKLFRLSWARRGQSTPDLEETATVALFAGLAAAHPEVQRDALDVVTRTVADRARAQAAGSAAPGKLSLVDALKQLAEPGEPSSIPEIQNYRRWWAALGAVTGTAAVELPGGPFFIGLAELDEVARAVAFVSAFCFVGDPP